MFKYNTNLRGTLMAEQNDFSEPNKIIIFK